MHYLHELFGRRGDDPLGLNLKQFIEHHRHVLLTEIPSPTYLFPRSGQLFSLGIVGSAFLPQDFQHQMRKLHRQTNHAQLPTSSFYIQLLFLLDQLGQGSCLFNHI